MFNSFEQIAGTEEFGNPFEEPTSEKETEKEDVFISDNPFNSNTPNNNQTITKEFVKKYNIVDLYWFINLKLVNNQKLNQDEVPLLVLGYNADFGNLRITFHEANSKTFTESAILKYETKQITTVNVFAETAFQILNTIQNKKSIKINNFERLFTASSTNDWKPNTTQIEINIPDSILIRTFFNNKIYSYTLLDWQIGAFINALKFMNNGDSWKSSLVIANK